jgi:hypothetical protein
MYEHLINIVVDREVCAIESADVFHMMPLAFDKEENSLVFLVYLFEHKFAKEF